MTLFCLPNAKGPVPVLMMFGQARVPAPSQPSPEELAKLNTALENLLGKDPEIKAILSGTLLMNRLQPYHSPDLRQGLRQHLVRLTNGVNGVNNDPPSLNQLIADGWGVAYVNPGSIQADNGTGLPVVLLAL